MISRGLAIVLLLAVLAGLACVAVKEDAPQPHLPLVNATARIWVDVAPAPPQFCPAPLPVCQHGIDCPAPIPRNA